MFEQQPMKMAAAEALCHTEQPAGFSVFAYGDVAESELREREESRHSLHPLVPGHR